jgi:hypothetical protein
MSKSQKVKKYLKKQQMVLTRAMFLHIYANKKAAMTGR